MLFYCGKPNSRCAKMAITFLSQGRTLWRKFNSFSWMLIYFIIRAEKMGKYSAVKIWYSVDDKYFFF